jgi:hypothetical protein
MPEEYAQRGDPARVCGVERLRSGGRFGRRNCRNEYLICGHIYAQVGILAVGQPGQASLTITTIFP